MMPHGARRIGTFRAPRARPCLRRSRHANRSTRNRRLRSLKAVVDAHQGQPGAAALARVLDEHHAGTTLTKSELEELFLALCEQHRVERPRVNARVAGLEVDFVFAARRLAVEVDGYRFHRTRKAFERDRERAAILAAAGYRVLRFSHTQVANRPQSVAAALRSSA